METNQHFSIQHRKFKKSALRLMAGVTFVLLLPQVNAAGVAKEAEVAKETTSAKEAAFTKEITIAAFGAIINVPRHTTKPAKSIGEKQINQANDEK